MATTKPRINVTLSHDNYYALKTYASSMGMTVSGLAAYFINSGIMTYNRTASAIERAPEILSSQISMNEILSEYGKEISEKSTKSSSKSKAKK